MTLMEQIITIVICILCVQFTRLLPFWIFPANRPIPEYIRYLGKVLPAAMFGMLVVYCYKNVERNKNFLILQSVAFISPLFLNSKIFYDAASIIIDGEIYGI